MVAVVEHALPKVAETVAQSMANVRMQVISGANGQGVSPFQLTLQSVMDGLEQYVGQQGSYAGE